MYVVEIKNLTKNYQMKRGVFDVSFGIEKGEVFGFLGPNGAGKTTTIRHLMGFLKPEKGEVLINEKPSWVYYYDNQKYVGYLPGEIVLPDNMTVNDFIKNMAEMRNIKNLSYTQYLLEKFEFNFSGKLKRISLGMKRKLAIVVAFMHDPEILILDEPTSGLDPMMQKVFIDFIKEEKTRGKTILLSSHTFSEIDALCDRIAIIKEGRIVSIFNADDLKHSQIKTFEIEFLNQKDYSNFLKLSNNKKKSAFEIVSTKEKSKQVQIKIEDKNINVFFEIIANYQLNFISEIKFTLKDYFLNFYGKDTN